MIVHRRGTPDEKWWSDMVEHNSHRLADDLSGATVLDAGANIGAFSYSALRRGAKLVHGYEMHEDQWLCSQINVERNFPGRARMHNAVVSPDEADAVYVKSDRDCLSEVAAEGHRRAASVVTLDHAIETLRQQAGVDSVGLVKVDIEGAEYPVLYGCRVLHRVENLMVEYHEASCRLQQVQPYMDPARSTGAALEAYLRGMGFQTRLTDYVDYWGDESLIGLGEIHCWRGKRDAVFGFQETSETMLKVNVGCGLMPLPGYENLDIQTYREWTGETATKVCDIRAGLPYPDNSIAEVRGDQLLEHLTLAEIVAFLDECQRVLCPLGEVRFSFPDIMAARREVIDASRVEALGQGIPGVENEFVAFNMLAWQWEHKTVLTVEYLLPMFAQRFTVLHAATFWTNGTIIARKE